MYHVAFNCPRVSSSSTMATIISQQFPPLVWVTSACFYFYFRKHIMTDVLFRCPCVCGHTRSAHLSPVFTLNVYGESGSVVGKLPTFIRIFMLALSRFPRRKWRKQICDCFEGFEPRAVAYRIVDQPAQRQGARLCLSIFPASTIAVYFHHPS